MKEARLIKDHIGFHLIADGGSVTAETIPEMKDEIMELLEAGFTIRNEVEHGQTS